ncbi:hypothetical protein ACJ5M5_003351 [Vibrio alginolyticus]
MTRSIADLAWFETFNDCVEENFERSRMLLCSGKEEAHNLGKLLYQCAEHNIPCNSAACKICNHRYKVTRVDSLVKKIKKLGVPCRVLTVIDYSRSVRREDLYDDITRNAKARWAQTLRRSNVHGPIVGAVELDFHEECSMWLLHVHFIYVETSHNKKAMREFRKRIGNQQIKHIKKNREARPTHKQPMRSPYRQVSYIYKLSSFRVQDYYDSINHKNRTRKVRLNIPETIEILCLMHRIKRRAFIFNYDNKEWE